MTEREYFVDAEVSEVFAGWRCLVIDEQGRTKDVPFRNKDDAYEYGEQWLLGFEQND